MYGVYIQTTLFAYHFQSHIYQILSRFYAHTHYFISINLRYTQHFFLQFHTFKDICNLCLSFHSNISIYILKYLHYCNRCYLNVAN
ncbi:conserved Plasmodium protein, unknown function [Plasmodium yoelii]|uniref:Uncharacterized protein n=1 Tax=Plasmodium yoelii TaxID=5861 RepID=A0A077Y875_PLAYE|nr:conserved Plasmodium protein, unknown function [Plasmodium yoelii]CDU18982.1 conserved Plasmodium protein, unknown function [Plasmodium yoelii]VTZ79567.1 conserved Plasmodium protein, unknown function [Plasmodium yoelii]|eukprot:XP_022812431.1 conserved Plasmodium protein, unknown function [Plasmodium yoelii]